VTPFAQAKYVAMKTLREDFDVRLVVPQVVRHVFAEYRPTLARGIDPAELAVVPSFGGRSNMTYGFDPMALAAVIRKFAPTHVHIEEDPHSVAGFEATLLASRLCPGAALSYFLWDNLNRTPGFPRNVVKRVLTRFGLSRARLVVCGNRDGQQLLAAKGYHGASEVIPQVGLDAAEAAAARPRNRDSNAPATIGFFGRLVDEKGILDLLNALGAIERRPWRLVVAGDGPLRGEIESHWKPRFGDRMELLGPISHAQVQAHLSNVDIFVLPSYSIEAWKEQFGITLVQAMFAGCACIGSTCGAIPEVLEGRGVIFAERDVSALSHSLARLIDSPNERIGIGENSRGFALSRYTNAAIARAYLKAFDAIAN